MIAIMRDALGRRPRRDAARRPAPAAGLPGRPRREPTAIANPELEWLSDELATAEEGCLSLPAGRRGRRAPAPRAGARADDDGEPMLIEASGLEARVLQHEIDHLDGVLILDRTEREQRKGALRALREGGTLQPPSDDEDERGRRERRTASRAERVRTRLPRHLGFRRRRAAAPGGPLTGPRWSSPRRTGRAGGAAGSAPPPAADGGAELGIELLQAADVNDAGGARGGSRRATRGWRSVCAFGQLIREPLLLRAELLNVHPSLLPRWRGAAPIERAIMAGDERDRGQHHAGHRGARRGPGRAPARRSRSSPRTTSARCRRGSRSSAAS